MPLKSILGSISFLLLFMFMLSLSAVMAQEAKLMDKKAIKAKSMIHVRSGKVIADVVILIEKNTITGVGSRLAIPDNSDIIDLGEVTILPGLIDVHTHLLHQYYTKYGDDNANRLLEMTQLSAAKRALLGVRLAREMLYAGFTSVRDLGNAGLNNDIALRDAISKGDVVGPRMFVSTRALSPVGGQFEPVTSETQNLIDQECPLPRSRYTCPPEHTHRGASPPCDLRLVPSERQSIVAGYWL